MRRVVPPLFAPLRKIGQTRPGFLLSHSDSRDKQHQMPLLLGAMPLNLQKLVERWIDDGRRTNAANYDPVVDALFIDGGPAACYYLKATGEVLVWDLYKDAVTAVDDGPHKVSTIVCAAQHRPEFMTWLPIRPLHAHDCEPCGGRGRLRPPLAKIIC